MVMLEMQVQLSITATFNPSKGSIIVDDATETTTLPHETEIGLCEVILPDAHVFCVTVTIT